MNNSNILNDTFNNTNQTDSNVKSNINENSYDYHTQYISLLIITMIAFFGVSYYLYYIAKYGIKKAKNNNSESNALTSKYDIIKSLSIANAIRGLSIAYIIISFNKNGNDFVSFINYVIHIIPSLIFISIFFSHVRFLIEKFYEIKTKKKDIFFAPTFQLLNIIIYTAVLILLMLCLTIKSYISFNFLSMGLICVLSLLLSLLYLIYGIRLANIFSIKNQNKEAYEIKEKTIIHNRILFVSTYVGSIYLIRSIFSFFICINLFKSNYPKFMSLNVWDCLTFILNELLCSLLIGYSRFRQDQIKNLENINFNNYDFNRYLNNLTVVANKDMIDMDNNDFKELLLDHNDKTY